MKALISVSDKRGVVEFATALKEMGWEIIATGGTMKMLLDSGLEVTGISEVTGFPEICGGRVKTLHPKVHGALLGRRDLESDMQQLAENGIGLIDLVCVNLYPFEATVAKPDVTLADAIENIDIGGPSMLRSAAKNCKSVTVVCEPDDYETVLAEIRANGNTTVFVCRPKPIPIPHSMTAISPNICVVRQVCPKSFSSLSMKCRVFVTEKIPIRMRNSIALPKNIPTVWLQPVRFRARSCHTTISRMLTQLSRS